ncbi:hypothetical protein UG55_100348 [Frankia sp. EI5c]|uniref:hypothetical protein n=1 Tax=Frankia sp. EI5c TaxID=683316 RepID=UPI0007C3628F|nr:hypothetical protein [Frankia sp. EI5c]OAA29237.1 hypothetical protein UG55_100348 [Frankia sp. EI5c]
MTNQAQILLNGLARSAVGLTALTRPTPIIRLAGVDRVTAEKTAWIARLTGIRDLVLGIGLLHAHATGGPTRTWLVAGLCSDTADTAVLAHATANGQLPVGYGTAMIAAAGGGAALAVRTLTATHPSSGVEQTANPPR